MRTTFVLAIAALAVGCGNADTVSYSSMGGGAGELSLAPIPTIDPEAQLTEGIFFMQSPDDIEIKMPEITAAPQTQISNKWDAPLKLSGGTAPKGKAIGASTLAVGSSEIGDGSVKVSSGGPLIEANFDPTAIRAVMKRNAGQVSYCHNVAKSRYSDVSGRVEIGFAINGGKVESAQVVSNSTGDDRMATCVLSKVMRMEFPNDMSVTSFNHPFVFQKG
jgi:hypothetical protein